MVVGWLAENGNSFKNTKNSAFDNCFGLTSIINNYLAHQNQEKMWCSLKELTILLKSTETSYPCQNLHSAEPLKVRNEKRPVVPYLISKYIF